MFETTYTIPNFSLNDTFDCGQVFRFNRVKDNEYEGFAGETFANIVQNGETVRIRTYEQTDMFEDYLDLKTDYGRLIEGFKGDAVLERAAKFCGGIRILKQDKWETLASFILSSNNNIKRIKGIIERFCSLFGNRVKGGYSFPRAQTISKLGVLDLNPIRAGFRAGYLIDAAQKTANKTVDLEKIDSMDLKHAKDTLKLIKGVGDKVAQCVLLFGFHKMDAFPIDVWMKKALAENYPDGLSKQLMSCPGFAQQILYHAKRNEALL